MHQTGKTYVCELDGLAKKMPLTFGCLTVASLSSWASRCLPDLSANGTLREAAFACGSLALAGGSRMGNSSVSGYGCDLFIRLL